MTEAAAPIADRPIGPVTVLFGAGGGKYPDGNSLLVRGGAETLIVDPALGVVARGDAVGPVDRVVNSHCHEDHIAGNHCFPGVPWHLPAADAPGITSLDDMMAIYGFDAATDRAFRKVLVEQFHYTPRPDPEPFSDGHVFDLDGVRVLAVHTPGHTRGHSCFRISWDGSDDEILYLGDIDLSGFGPYYGDAWSDLEAFERSIEKVREIDVRYYATFHHIGVLEGHAAFAERLDRFAARIEQCEAALLEFLVEPRSIDDIGRHSFIYRPNSGVVFAEAVERRSMGQHVARLIRQGRVEEVEPGRYRTA
ncbi:MAG: MBL fold metallo-hydrolase [Myxococcota bacterium]|nr:MBL fold metallo-hydrolase [Myxococcota bacterium]